MEINYDEDLLKNIFVGTLKLKHPDLLDEICRKHYLLCVPQASVVRNLDSSIATYQGHILRPQDDRSTVDTEIYFTLNSKTVLRRNNYLQILDGVEKVSGQLLSGNASSTSSIEFRPPSASDEQGQLTVQVLFEETHVLPNEQSFRILCVNQPLTKHSNGATSSAFDSSNVSPGYASASSKKTLFSRAPAASFAEDRSLEYYEVILFGSGEEEDVLRQTLDRSLKEFAERLSSIFKPSRARIVACDLALITKMEFAKIWSWLQRTKYDQPNSEIPTERQTEMLKLAAEVYFFNYVHDIIWSTLASMSRRQDESFNRMLMQLSNLEPCDLDVDSALFETIPSARKELKRLNLERSPHAKILRLRKTVQALNLAVTANSSHHSADDNSDISFVSRRLQNRKEVVLNPDTLIPVLVFLVLKCGVFTWETNLEYMLNFHFCNSDTDELGYCLASFEAAIEYLRNAEHLKSLVLEKLVHKPIATFSAEASVAIEDAKQRMKDRIRNGNSLSSEFDENEHCVEAFRSLVVEAITYDSAELIEALFNVRCNVSDCEAVSELSSQPSDLSLNGSVDQTAPSSVGSNLPDDGVCELSPLCSPRLNVPPCHPLCECSNCVLELQHRGFRLSINSCIYGGKTALHYAALLGKPNAIDAICKLDADANLEDDHQQTPLHLACRAGHQRGVLLLLHYGSDPCLADALGNTALHIAVTFGHIKCVKALLFYQSTKAATGLINLKNANGDTAVHLAARLAFYDVLYVLIENGASVRIRNRREQLPYDLCDAVDIQQLLNGRPPQDAVAPQTVLPSRTVAALAKTSSSQSIASLSEPSDADKLLRAVLSADLSAVRLHLGVPDDVCLADRSNAEAQDAVNRGGNGAQLVPCHPLCLCEKCVRKSVSESSNINACGSSGLAPLHTAVKANLLEMTELLLRLGADVFQRVGQARQTPLHFAVLAGSTAVVSALLNAGSDVNEVDRNGRSALHLACASCNAAVVELLLQASALVDRRDHVGNTPLHEAAKTNSLRTKDVAVALLNAGAKKNAQNDLGLLPLDLTKNKELTRLLKVA